jgi:hypothetical protein
MEPQALNAGNYPSVTEFLSAAEGECCNPDNKHHITELMTSRRGDDWFGARCKTGNDVKQLIETGWEEGRKKVAAFAEKIDLSEATPHDLRRRKQWCELGDTLDISAVYAGRHNMAWSRAKRQYGVAQQRVEILSNMICYGGEDSAVLFNRGAAAVALSDILESRGYITRIVVGFAGPLHGVSCRITVKDYDKPLDISTASAILLPGFFRAIGHSWVCGHDRNMRYSCGIDVGECQQEPGEILLSHEVRSIQSAEAWVKSSVAAINTRFESEALI